MIKLGSRVKHKITGFEGILITKNEWLNGCVRYNIQPEKLHEGKPIDSEWFDAKEVELITEKTGFVEKKGKIKKSTGGLQKDPKRFVKD